MGGRTKEAACACLCGRPASYPPNPRRAISIFGEPKESRTSSWWGTSDPCQSSRGQWASGCLSLQCLQRSTFGFHWHDRCKGGGPFSPFPVPRHSSASHWHSSYAITLYTAALCPPVSPTARASRWQVPWKSLDSEIEFNEPGRPPRRRQSRALIELPAVLILLDPRNEKY